jgi:hypothetical protein
MGVQSMKREWRPEGRTRGGRVLGSTASGGESWCVYAIVMSVVCKSRCHGLAEHWKLRIEVYMHVLLYTSRSVSDRSALGAGRSWTVISFKSKTEPRIFFQAALCCC